MNKLWKYWVFAAPGFVLLCAGSAHAATCGDSTHVSQVTVATNSKGQQTVSCVSIPIAFTPAAPAPAPAPTPAPAPAPSPSPAQPVSPTVTQTFDQAITGFNKINDYEFGTNSGRNVNNLTDLAAAFDPYGIAGTTVIQKEWERYQTFNSSNFVFGPHTLDLTTTLLSGLHAGGINSGQIASKQTFHPGVTGYNTYAFEVRMKVPNALGAWTGAWFYCKQPDKDDHSEIDNPEFLNMKNQNQFDWTGFNHGPNVGSDFHSIMSNQWTWRPGMDFSADYHSYQTVWTPTAVYKYVDGQLVRATNFKYTSPGPAQLLVSLAVGSDNTTDLPGLQPNSASEFPIILSVDHITVWAK